MGGWLDGRWWMDDGWMVSGYMDGGWMMVGWKMDSGWWMDDGWTHSRTTGGLMAYGQMDVLVAGWTLGQELNTGHSPYLFFLGDHL